MNNKQSETSISNHGSNSPPPFYNQQLDIISHIPMTQPYAKEQAQQPVSQNLIDLGIPSENLVQTPQGSNNYQRINHAIPVQHPQPQLQPRIQFYQLPLPVQRKIRLQTNYPLNYVIFHSIFMLIICLAQIAMETMIMFNTHELINEIGGIGI